MKLCAILYYHFFKSIYASSIKKKVDVPSYSHAICRFDFVGFLTCPFKHRHGSNDISDIPDTFYRAVGFK